MPRPGGADHSSLASKARISLRTDLDKLMEQFLLTESIRYQEFARVWQQLNFALIYAGLKDSKEKREFIIDAYDLVSEYLQPPFDLQRRVCALYTLYGLYYTQTHHPRIKIRMSLEDWKETLALHDDLQEQGHLDALYIFHKMRLDKAFMFTATHSNMYYLGRGAKKPEDFEKWAAKHQSFMASVLDEDLLQELEHVHASYQDGKQTSTFEEDPSMAIVKESMSDFIMERISNIDVQQMSEESDSDALIESRTRASLLREIKKRSFASPTKASQSRRSKTTTDDSGTDDPAYRPTKSRSKRGKKKGRPPKGESARGRGRPRKMDSDTSSSSPSKKRKLESADTPNVKKMKKTSAKKSNSETVQRPGDGGLKVEKSEEKPKVQSPVDDKSKVNNSEEKKKMQSSNGGSKVKKAKEKKKKTSKKSKDAVKEKSKKAEKLQDKSKKKLFTDEVDDAVETPSTSKEKRGRPKRKTKKDKGESAKSQPAKGQPTQGKSAKGQPARGQPTKGQSAKSQPAKGQPTKGQPSISTRSKKPSSDANETIEVKVKVETPSKASPNVTESPRKRPRKSSTPKRITRSHEKL